MVIRFGERLRARRKQTGWSQEHLAARAELDRAYVSGLERGEQVPSLVTIHKLARALGIRAGELIDD